MFFLTCRTALAIMHFNENSNRPQAINSKGQKAFTIKFPKYKHGGFTVRMVPEKSTFGNV
jgi:hypothetical protein